MFTDNQRIRHIYDLQRFLRRLQLAQGAPAPLVPDGIFGPETTAALRAFQRQHRLPPSGQADYDTWTALYAAYAQLSTQDQLAETVAFFPPDAQAVLKQGGKGPAILVLQLMLDGTAAHFSSDVPAPAPTGSYDAETTASVQQFQRAAGLPDTGITDFATWNALTRLHNALHGKTPAAWLAAE